LARSVGELDESGQRLHEQGGPTTKTDQAGPTT